MRSFLAVLLAGVLTQPVATDCASMTRGPLTSKDAATTPPKVVHAGERLSPEQRYAVSEAIDHVERWEKNLGVLPYEGNAGQMLCSKALRGLMLKSRICVEKLDFYKHKRATTFVWDATWNDEENRLEFKVDGSKAIHIRSEFLPRVDPRIKPTARPVKPTDETWTKEKVFRLALILLHESGHLLDNDQDHGSYAEMEQPIYLWVSKQIATMLEVEKPGSLKNILLDEWQIALDFVATPPKER